MSTTRLRRLGAAGLGMMLAISAACGEGQAQTAQPTPAANLAVENTGAAPAEATPAGTQAAEVEASEVQAAAVKVNLNTATADELIAAIPDLGNRMVREFFEYRPYLSIQQFRREIGKYVDDAQVAAYEQYVYVPIEINESDAETLQQIPGLDAAEATQLMSARPFGSNDSFLDTLAAYVAEVDLAAAASYLATP